MSQTVLGLTDGADLGDPRSKAEPVHLTVSTTPSFPDRGQRTFTSHPVVIAPHRTYLLHFTHDTSRRWYPCHSEYWTDLSLQVRVGFFTRTETLDFGPMIIELRSPGSGC